MFHDHGSIRSELHDAYSKTNIWRMVVAGVCVEEQQEDVKWASLIDEINAYSYSYPLELPSKKFVFKWYVELH